MLYRKVLGTDIEVSAICQGTMRFAAKEQGEDDKSKAGEQAMRHALDVGVNCFHSSYQYRTRWVMERVLRDHPKRSDLHHIIKVVVPAKGGDGDFNPATFRNQVEDALRELHAERISFIQWLFIHTDPEDDEQKFIPSLSGMIDDMMTVFEKMRDEGKVGYPWSFARTRTLRRALIRAGPISGMVARYNLLDMEMAEVFGEMQSRNMSLIPIVPLCAGLLIDKRRDRSALPVDDRFREAKYHSDYEALAEVTDKLGDQIGDSLTRFAIRFALASPVIPSIAISLNTSRQVDGAAEALNGTIPPDAVVQQALRIWQSRTGVVS